MIRYGFTEGNSRAKGTVSAKGKEREPPLTVSLSISLLQCGLEYSR